MMLYTHYFGRVSTKFCTAFSSAPRTAIVIITIVVSAHWNNYTTTANRLTHSPALPLFQSTTIGLSTLSLIPGPAISSAFIASLVPVAPFNTRPTLFSPTNSRIERNWSGVGNSGASTTSSSKRGFFSSARAAASSSERTRSEAAHVGVWKSVRTSSALCWLGG